jgi:hypothetical protein
MPQGRAGDVILFLSLVQREFPFSTTFRTVNFGQPIGTQANVWFFAYSKSRML